ncbi:MAG: Eco57I restriction-modification methylase domain-containing protein [Promethearchaeota archaeon]
MEKPLKENISTFLDLFSLDNSTTDLNFRATTLSEIFNGMRKLSPSLLLGTLYETYLNLSTAKNHRKIRGIFYTPLEIVEYILDKTLQVKLNETAVDINLSLLDPACGIGIFLIAAFQRISVFLNFRKIPKDKLKHILQRFYGIDIDPFAISICKMWFICELARYYMDPKNPKMTLKEFVPLLSNIHVGNTLKTDLKRTLSLKPNEGFTIVFGNPPYLAVKRGHFRYEKKVLQESFSLAKGQFDAYELFIERAYQVLINKGFLGLILPRRFLTNEKNKLLRQFLLKNFEIYTLAEVGAPFQASVETAILIAMKIQKEIKDQKSKENQRVELLPAKEFWSSQKGRYVPQKLLKKLPFSIFNVNLDEELYTLICKISSDAKPLKEWGVTIRRGIEIGKKNPLIMSKAKKGYQKLLRGEDIHPFAIHFKEKYLLLQPNTSAFKSPTVFASPKILVRRVANSLIAAFDEIEEYLTLNTLYNIRLNQTCPFSHEFLVGLLNSRLHNFWLRHSFAITEKIFPYIRISQLAKLPIKFSQKKSSLIESHVKKIIELKRATDISKISLTQLTALYYQIDKVIFQLYEITPQEQGIIKRTEEPHKR